MKRKIVSAHVGSSFESFLLEHGQLASATARANKAVLVWQLASAMRQKKVSKAELARRMRTSPGVVRRLMDRRDASISLSTIVRAATALGRNVAVRLDSRG